MPATEQINIKLPAELAQKVREAVAFNGYVDESELIQSCLEESLLHASELDSWISTVGVARYDEYDANPNDVFTWSEVVASVEEDLKKVSK